MVGVARTKLTRNAIRDGVLLGKRWPAAEALAAAIIDKASADPLKDAIALGVNPWLVAYVSLVQS